MYCCTVSIDINNLESILSILHLTAIFVLFMPHLYQDLLKDMC